jgi:ParB family chromosome partitioning protein
MRLGKTQSTIANKLRLLKLDDNVKDILLKEELTERHARALLAVDDTKFQFELLKYIVANRLNVEETEKYIRDKTEEQIKPEKRQIRMMKIKDLRIFFNSVNRAVDIIKAAGINVDACQQENEEYIEYTIKIPKKDAYVKRDEIA